MCKSFHAFWRLVYIVSLAISILSFNYRNNPKYWDRQSLAISVDPDQTPQHAASDQGLYCLPFMGIFVDTSTGSKLDLFNYYKKYGEGIWYTNIKG